jgi:hypothetical protein
MRIKKPKNVRIKDVVRSAPKTTHAKAISVPKSTHPGSNLGRYLHKSKLPSGAKIGAGVKVKLRKSSKVKGY